ncbi:MAG: PilZ domain-containing protein, partial [Deltaproteobacteria bacterium]|nr:PilZ domain-containing protein [Deltaproteobacteria bacterium]
MTVRTVLADEKGMIYVLCPFCGDNSMKPAKLFPVHKPVGMACSCGNTYEFQIEVRKDFRKTTTLGGFYVKQDSAGHFETMTVTDLSLDGCSLLVSDKHTLQLGDSIKVVFKLDNPKRTE